FIPWHFPLHEDTTIQGASKKAETEFEKLYPTVFNHLSQFKESLKNRNKAETGIRYEWYALQRAATTYLRELEKEKVVWGNISYDSEFCFVDKGIYINAPSNFIISKNTSIKYLLANMNSSLFNWLFKQVGIFLGHAFEWKKQYVEQVKIPPITSSNQSIVQQIEELVDKILSTKKENPLTDTSQWEQEIDRLVYSLYDLTEEEIKIVEGKT
ncbi:TaqI-like C-terminal specificity domain-containing protein, partial [Thermosipho sp. (in: thermotogales)]|uniref:TaqI-like C-terminal specificity domain-containing protein n=1 Tax=Thermosipho sp. (in: thermotogales) TaxID=1968895 RepID=UPI0025800182